MAKSVLIAISIALYHDRYLLEIFPDHSTVRGDALLCGSITAINHPERKL